MFITAATESNVPDAIVSLKNSFTMDYYELNAEMMKGIANYLIDPLTLLFNTCIENDIFPDCLK